MPSGSYGAPRSSPRRPGLGCPASPGRPRCRPGSCPASTGNASRRIVPPALFEIARAISSGLFAARGQRGQRQRRGDPPDGLDALHRGAPHGVSRPARRRVGEDAVRPRVAQSRPAGAVGSVHRVARDLGGRPLVVAPAHPTRCATLARRRGVAQPGRVLALGARCRRFESSRPDHRL